MMFFNNIFAWLIKKRIRQIDFFKNNPTAVQENLLKNMLVKCSSTKFGGLFSFKDISDYQTFSKRVPLHDYTTIYPFVEEVLQGKQDVLWPGLTSWFSKSSGTTSHRSKILPVTKEHLFDCHYKGGKDLLSLYYHNYPNRKLYNGKHLIIGGSSEINTLGKNSYIGDLSAIIIKNLPFWAEIRRTPSRETSLLSNWEEKLDKMVKKTIHEDVFILAGVPSWTLVLLKRILEYTGKKHIKEVWPNLELYMHGGVNFAPYKSEFETIIGKKINYVETYNSSEGFYGIQDQPNSDELLLMLDYGIFYEFIPMDTYDSLNSQTVLSLADVEINKNYALVISTNAGLWRYIIGDTISFTSKYPYRFKITGRTTQCLNVFGEEIIVENADRAIAEICTETNAFLKDYAVFPVYLENNQQGGHEWFIEFSKEPNSKDEFTILLDQKLQEINSDYAAKRQGDFVLTLPKINFLPENSFETWLIRQNKLGGQNKIPRLNNTREIAEQLHQLIQDHV
jgi:hypothetical protein